MRDPDDDGDELRLPGPVRGVEVIDLRRPAAAADDEQEEDDDQGDDERPVLRALDDAPELGSDPLERIALALERLADASERQVELLQQLVPGATRH
jgi:hypothetical protein